METIIILYLITISSVSALIGYDCGSPIMNVTTLSLVDVGKCDIPEYHVKVTQQYLQLLQINDYSETDVIQCKIEIHRTVYYCGMNSHVSVVQNGEAEYIMEISQQACENLHNTGVLRYSDVHTITGVKINETTTRSLTFVGSISPDGRCYGAVFSDPYGTWENVVVQGTIKISLGSHLARVNTNSDKLYLKSGATCHLADNNCLDSIDGNTFWKSVTPDACRFNRFSVLFEGYANKMIDDQLNHQQAVYSIATNDITFALSVKKRENVCGYTIIKTEHPKLVIFETTRGNTFALNNHISVSNLDIFAYVNSKFIYVERHIRAQIKDLYRDVILQQCKLEKQTIKNTLAIATQAPDEFAYNLMRGPGYMAVLAGEVVHLIKCIPVEVKIEHGEHCFAELQVSRKNETFFLTPRTHILKKKGTQINCNECLPAYYQIGETWYKILPRPTEALPPATIQPLTKPTWKYINPAELATSGIYTEQDLKDLRDHIMFPIERGGLLNDVVREMRGHSIVDKDGTLKKLLNEDFISEVAQSAWQSVWTNFMSFGTASAGVIAILMILQFLKLITNIIVRGYTLHNMFGWST